MGFRAGEDNNRYCSQGIYVPGDPDSIQVTYLPTTIGTECGCYELNYQINGKSYYADGPPASSIIQEVSVIVSDPAVQMLAAEEAAGAEGALPLIAPEALGELALAGVAADAVAETTAAAAETAGPQLLGTINLSEDLTFGTTSFGNAAHVETANLFEQLYPEVAQNGGFSMRVLPGQTGVDVTVGEQYVDQVGFQFAEIKPLSASGAARFNQQVLNWNLQSPVQAITYDANGNVFLRFH